MWKNKQSTMGDGERKTDDTERLLFDPSQSDAEDSTPGLDVQLEEEEDSEEDLGEEVRDPNFVCNHWWVGGVPHHPPTPQFPQRCVNRRPGYGRRTGDHGTSDGSVARWTVRAEWSAPPHALDPGIDR